MQAKIIRTSKQTVKLNNTGGTLNSTKEVTLKNQLTEFRSIEDILDVEEIDVVDGATLVYNATTGKYEVRPLDFGDVEVNVDGGEY